MKTKLIAGIALFVMTAGVLTAVRIIMRRMHR